VVDVLDAFPPPPPPPPADLRPARPVRALALGIALLVAAGAIALVVRSSRGDGFAHPDEWDPRVAELAAFVEEARGLEFDHPVFVDFLSPDAYREEATAEEADLTDDERASLAHDAGVLRALGVASGPLDLLEALNTVTDGGTLAFYDPDDRRVRVRGTEVTVGLQVTLVHELTHALQDQAFGLDRLDDEDLDSSGAAAFRAVVEGDALRVEDEYVERVLDPDEQATYEKELTAEIEASEEATGEVPPFLGASFSAPYLLGRPFVTMLVNEGGNAAVDDALRDPPTTEEHLFDPASYLAEEGAEAVDLDLADDLDVRDEGPFGAPAWFLVLAERIDPLVAFEATLGWAGDAYATFDRDGTACVRGAFAGDRPSDDDEMRAALDAWAQAMPPGVVALVELDGHPGFETCDPGADTTIELTGRSGDALTLPSLWGYLVADAATVADATAARCYAAGVIDELTYEEVVDPSGAVFTSDRFQQALGAAYTACRLGGR